MNKAILAAVAGMASVVSVSAQGTVSLNTATGEKPRITINGANVVAADNVWVQVLVGSVSADPFQLTLGGANAGLFSKGTFTAAGLAPGSTQSFTINAWDKDTGDDFAKATVKGSKSFNIVLGALPDANGIPSLPASIVGANLFTGTLNLVPEPSTYALAALGLGGLLFLRRK